MASNYWTDDRIRVTRVQAAFVRCNDIVKEFVEIKLSQKLGRARADFPSTWKQWCHDNITFIRRYIFWREQAKEVDDGKVVSLRRIQG